MKKLLIISLLLSLFACGDNAPDASKKVHNVPDTSDATRISNYEGFNNDREALAYALGADQGQGLLRRGKYLKRIGVDLDNELTKQGFLDAFADAGKSDKEPKTVKLDIEQMKTLIYGLSREQKKLEQALARAESDEQIAKGNAFMDEYRKKKGVQETESGLLYRVLISGGGNKPKYEDTVLAHYQGRLTDGSVFDDSRQRGEEPSKFMVSAVIAGWTEALQMMRVGDKWEVVIPPGLAYGASRHDSIPANAVLIFDIDLKKILPKKK